MPPEGDACVRVVQSGKRDVFVCTCSGQVTVYKRYHIPSRWTGSLEPISVGSLPPWLVVQPFPKPRFTVSDVAVSFSGKFAILSGSQDGRAALGLLMLTPSPGRSVRHVDGVESVQGSFYPWMAPKVGRGTPSILKIKWFKGSDMHVCVLTSNNHLVIYKAREGPVMEAEQIYALWVGSGQPSCGYIGNERWITDFSFGPCTLWGVYSLFFLCSDGALFLLCPVVPHRNCVPSVTQQQMKESIEGLDISNGQEFLRALGFSGDKESVETTNQGESLTGHFTGINLELTSVVSTDNGFSDHGFCPSLQGPLNANCESFWSDEDTNTEASSFCITADDSGVGIIAVAASSGVIYFHSLLDDVLPMWSSVQPKRGYYPCPMSATDNILIHLYSAVVPKDECLEIFEIPCASGEFVCWGTSTAVFHISIPSLEGLCEGPQQNSTALDENLSVEPIKSLAHVNSRETMGVLWTNDEAMLVYKNQECIEIFPFDISPKWNSVFRNMENKCPYGDHVSVHSLNNNPDAPGGSSTLGGSPTKASSLELIQELQALFDVQLATAQRCHEEVDAYGQYLEQKIRTEEVIVESYDKQYVNWEELWTVMDTWPSTGSCELIHELDSLDIEAVRALVMGLRGACEQSEQPRHTVQNKPSRAHFTPDLTAIAQATKENDLLVLGAKQLLSKVKIEDS